MRFRTISTSICRRSMDVAISFMSALPLCQLRMSSYLLPFYADTAGFIAVLLWNCVYPISAGRITSVRRTLLRICHFPY